MRYLLCLPIMIIHTTAVPGVAWWLLVLRACNCAVPAFFMISGYVQAAGRSESRLAPQFVRLIAVYLVWFAIYNGLPALLDGERINVGPRALVTGGAGFHLWFLPALACSLPLVSLGCRRIGTPATALLCLVLALAPDIWPGMPAGRSLHAPLYVLTGRLWARHASPVPLAVPALAFVLIWLLPMLAGSHVQEIAGPLGERLFEASLVYASGVAAFVFGVSLPASPPIRLFARLGVVTLGVYAMHLLLLANVAPSLSNASFAVVFGRALAVLAVATVLSFVLAALPGAWRLVANRRVRPGARSGGSGVVVAS